MFITLLDMKAVELLKSYTSLLHYNNLQHQYQFGVHPITVIIILDIAIIERLLKRYQEVMTMYRPVCAIRKCSHTNNDSR